MSDRISELRRLAQNNRAERLAGWTVMLYFTIYAFESPVRYILHLVHAGPVIIARDLLILGPLALIGVRGLFLRQLRPAFLVFGLFIGISAAISFLNFGTLGPSALGIKILVNVLFGLVVGASIIIPNRMAGRWLAALWLATVIGLLLEKYVMTFPWVGVQDVIGGVSVEISRDWQVNDPDSQRVGGFTRESISAAGLLANLALIGVFRYRAYAVRAAILLVTIGSIYLTTQKGALIGILLTSVVLCGPARLRLPTFRLMIIAGVLLEVGLPLFTNGIVMAQGHGGVFSGASLAERIDDTWPNSLIWISDHQLFPFGIGLGGIGAAQQLLGNISEHYPDNMFLLLYAFFGLPCLTFFSWMIYAAVRSIAVHPDVAGPALAVLAFNLIYGTVVTILEDQAGALFLGGALGVLLAATWLPYLQPTLASGRVEPATG